MDRMHLQLILYQLHWLPIEYWIWFKALVITVKALYLQRLVYLQDHLSPM